MTTRTVCRLVVLLMLIAVPVLAQDVGAFRAVGRVRDSLGTPIPGAVVTTQTSRAETDSTGRFALRLVRTDSTTISIRRLGFESVTFTMLTDSLALNDIEIQLVAVASPLKQVAVKAERVGRVPSIDRFEERRRENAGLGFFMGRDEIAQREGMPLSSILSQARGVRLVRTGNGRALVRFTRWGSKGSNCAPHTWIDGALVRNLEVDDLHSADVQALELYPNSSSAPTEFQVGSQFACGIVVLWTRRPILDRK